MGIYEALVWSPAGLAAPGGVTFPPNSASYDADMTAWNDLLPMLTTQMFEGRYIMAIIQARNTGRPWSDEPKLPVQTHRRLHARCLLRLGQSG